MRKYQIILGSLALLALLAITAGCPAPEDPELGIEPTPPMNDIDDVEVTEVNTVGDLLAAWPSSFVMEIDFEDKDTGETESLTMTMTMGDDGPAKMKMEHEEEPGAFILDYEDMMILSWDVESGHGMQLPLSEDEDGEDLEGVANPYGEIDLDTPIVGSETIDGVECWVAEYTVDDETAKIYYAKNNGLVQRIESDTIIATYSYSDIDAVDDSVFEVPEGIELMDLSELGDLEDMMVE